MPRKTHNMLAGLFCLGIFAAGAALAQTGPQTAEVDLERYAEVVYVSTSTGQDSRRGGSKEHPWATIGYALSRVEGEPRPVAVLVAAGSYAEHAIQLLEEVDLYGGYDPETWKRDVWRHRTILDAGRRGRVLVAADRSLLDGFEVTGGTIRGKGAGILIDGVSPVLSNNFFTGNKTLGPENWAPRHLHETAHDGGAVYCRNGGNPVFVRNVFFGNRTENGRGAAIAYDGRCNGKITGNVFVDNVAGLEDPMRSSDGGAISVFRWSSPVIADNVVLGNAAINKNDGGGIFVALWSSAKVHDNVIVDNEAGDDAGGLFVGGQEHRYDAPLDPLPDAGNYYVEVTGNRFFGNRNSSRNSGATRITMETRGLVARNLAALNYGFYVQRSEIEAVNNTILEDLLWIETKEGLGPGIFRGNIVLGGFELDTGMAVTNSLFRDGYPGSGNRKGAPDFIDDGMDLRVLTASYSRRDFQTTLTVADSLAGDGLDNRVVVSGDHWGVIRSSYGHTITLWGDLSGATRLIVLPTYRQKSSSPGFGLGADAARQEAAGYEPRRVNKVIELLEQGEPVYYQSGYGGYREGLAMAGTWADYIVYNMEHNPLDFGSLRAFMQGLVDAGPTRSGHRTPAVIAVLPLLGLGDDTVLDGGWMVQQALAQGVHGVHLAKARDPAAVRRFVQAARYSIHEQGADELGEGLRGWGSHLFAASVWGLEREEYLRRADVWPLNPDGEIMLGVKLEDQQALANAESTLAVPGIAFAEHGPRDLGLSFGHLEGRADPPLPPEVNAAGDRVLELARRNGLYFLDNVLPENVVSQIDRGVMIGAGSVEAAAEAGRAYTKREMPW